jgi:hypothetical protein
MGEVYHLVNTLSNDSQKASPEVAFKICAVGTAETS